MIIVAPAPAPVQSQAELDLIEALQRFRKSKSCPLYLRTAVTAWLDEVSPA